MLLKSVGLTNFRNYSRASFTFSPQTTLVVGPNASGKTNLLEAIYFLATGRSFRARYDREAIKSGEVLAQVKGIKGLKGVKEAGESLEVAILANENGKRTSSKRFQVNGVKKRLADFAGNLRAVVFSPEEILLVTGSPSRRRRFMDSVLVQVDREYARSLAEYEKVLRQRNRLLVLLREKGLKGIEGVNEQMAFWDERLVVLGSNLTRKRREFLESINNQLSATSNLFLQYRPRTLDRERLEREYPREVGAGMTLWGPHREDFVFKFKVQSSKFKTEDGRDLSRFGSRGEQRLAVLHLKIAELAFITQRVGERPVLLLDDIFSELDENNRGWVLGLLGRQQTIITTTDREDFRDGSEVSTINLAL